MKSRESKLPHTDQIMRDLDKGDIAGAMQKHNAFVNSEFKRAEQGEVINLSDLLASKEEIDLKQLETKETIGHKEAECSICGSQLSYVGAVQPGEEDIFYRVKCESCGAEGKEWYSTQFSEVRMTPRSEE